MGVQNTLCKFKTTIFGSTVMLLSNRLGCYLTVVARVIRLEAYYGKSSYVCVNRNCAAKQSHLTKHLFRGGLAEQPELSIC